MLASELIKELQKIIDNEGDKPVMVLQTDSYGDNFYSDLIQRYIDTSISSIYIG